MRGHRNHIQPFRKAALHPKVWDVEVEHCPLEGQAFPKAGSYFIATNAAFFTPHPNFK